ncbi:hypothetical protein PTKIN_Ptkin04bG0022200 [Pterospermum kingtungense]
MKKEGASGINWLYWDKLCVNKNNSGLRFRNLQGSNLAMLGKQGWRLATNPDTLIGRIFKARYYPRGDFLNAQLGQNPSFTWRSIWSSQVLLQNGFRWRIGNGKDVDVWSEPWLRDSSNLRVQTEMPSFLCNLKVADLMLRNQRAWDTDFLYTVFDDRDLESVMAIKIPPKTKSFLWRACRACWLEAGLLDLVKSCAEKSESFEEWVFKLLQTGGDCEVSKIVTIMAQIWKSRNDLIWNSIQWHVPPSGYLKCNIDAFVPCGLSSYGIGMIIRDEFGDFVAGKMIPGKGVVSAKEAEAIGLLEALPWVEGLGHAKVLFELDALSVVKDVGSTITDLLEYGSIIRRCRNHLISKSVFLVHFVRRQANEVAHVIPREARL